MASSNTTAPSPLVGVPFEYLLNLTGFIFYDPAGDAIGFEVADLDTTMHNNMVIVIHAGVRIAAAVVVGALLLLIARSYKSMMFCLYQTNMAIMLIGSALQIAYSFSPASSIIIALTGGEIPGGSLRLGVATTVFQMLLAFSLLASLVVQVHAATSDQRKVVQLGVTLVAIIGCFPTYLIWLWRCVLVGLATTHQSAADALWVSRTPTSRWVQRGAWPAFAASTSFLSLILCIKLWMVHRARAKMGLNHYDPIKIIFVMALQNSVIPAILAIVSASMSTTNFGAQSVSAASLVLTAVLQPTGYIWAQFEILTGSCSKDTLLNTRNMHTVDVEKAKSYVHSNIESYIIYTYATGCWLKQLS